MREIPRSRFDLLWFALSLFITAVLFYSGYKSLFVEPVGVGLLLLAAPGVFFFWLTVRQWRSARYMGPALVIQDSGLIFPLISPSVLPWRALRDVYLGPIDIPQRSYCVGRHLQLRFEPRLLPLIRREPLVPPIFTMSDDDASVFSIDEYDVDVDLRTVRDLILSEWERALRKTDPTALVTKEVPLQLDETRFF